MSIHEAMRMVRIKNRQAELRKGSASEHKVDEALELLRNSEIISSFWNASGSDDQIFGIDKHIQLPNGEIIDLQVKSSKRGADTARQNFPHIPVIQVVEEENLESLSNRIRGLIQSKLKGKF